MKTKDEILTAWSPASEIPEAESDFDLFRRQDSILALINLALIAVLLVTHAVFLPYIGGLTVPVVLTLSFGLFVKAAEFAWLRAQTTLPERTQRAITCWSIGFNAVLTFVVMLFTRGEDSQTFILMAVPVVEAASRFNLLNTVGVIALANLLNLFEAYSLDSMDEYFEAGATSLIYTFVGLVWLLVNNLRSHQERLKQNISELESTRERLLNEEKLAAVGRLSSAIAHEIRNPVAMIASSLETANRPGQDQTARKEMFEIAEREAARLERLTTDFLTYARPQALNIATANVSDVLDYVAAVARSHAQNKGVSIQVVAPADLAAQFDASQIHQALLNLVLNAIDACKPGDTVSLTARLKDRDRIVLDVCDSVGPIPSETASHLFEPFFSTKPGGTGLGLAIARNAARRHSGDLMLSKNEPSMVCFAIEIPARFTQSSAVELINGENINR